jgi:hypothetical protein
LAQAYRNIGYAHHAALPFFDEGMTRTRASR